VTKETVQPAAGGIFAGGAAIQSAKFAVMYIPIWSAARQDVGGKARTVQGRSSQSTAASNNFFPWGVTALGRCQKKPIRLAGALKPSTIVPPFS
jgi:hypothetical protein